MKSDDLAHGTYKHIKVTLSAMFTFAKREGVYDGVNPMTGVTVPKGKKHGRRRPAYTLQEVENTFSCSLALRLSLSQLRMALTLQK